ncbi:probable 28S ribosomal protein S6, mitochondrial [Nasonia vitripennis]|uniref:Small ribosomal subunit protein bS6m n=1 Tax=Nasonia vitripennis TaxID=7425 RepID=A0A7M7QRW2_NASVI|nr:probable 28S ribosomal protein S6, mitochondrial [Nasonia vitripennis]XP_008213720.1 probable 28S ribosomal protein S6, mitochondrial [Nasonia vitripennis]XP_016839069.1 probable 28S ribosomal protein S6, mitochondrial [Nasonia vitripennis]XP_032453668.1 probable 28S ribosomal protein S6, mitochondrial [Nasonia vitripennis]XP_032453669.1 probable 28S ribosomal protein S6, mitochondrial [Nasonia vitripennis]
MPAYEMPLLLKIMTRPELVVTLKRTAESIFKKGGFIRKIDNLGKLATPYRMSANNETHKEANYFIIHFDLPPSKLATLNEECQRDIDIVKCKIYNKNEDKKIECTLHEELLPPAYRPQVQKMLAIGAKQQAKKDKLKHKFKFNTGLDYYPFQR